MSLVGNSLIEQPSAFSSNTNISTVQPSDYHDESSVICIGGGIISNGSENTLYVKALIDNEKDVAWFITADYSQTCWHIQDMYLTRGTSDEAVIAEPPSDIRAAKHKAGYVETEFVFLTEILSEEERSVEGGTPRRYNLADGKDPDITYYDSERNMMTIPLRTLAQDAMKTLYDITGCQIDKCYVVSSGSSLSFMLSEDGYDREVFYMVELDPCTGEYKSINIAYKDEGAEYSPVSR